MRGTLRKGSNQIIPFERIAHRIILLRGQKIMVSTDLAVLYQVEPRALVQAVRRNTQRFPPDFMFTLTKEEFARLRSQSVISKSGRGGGRYPPLAFTEHGIAMLSSVLRSERAVQVNIAIMRAFVHLRQILLSHKQLAEKLISLERKYDGQFKIVFDAIRELLEPPARRRRVIGFRR